MTNVTLMTNDGQTIYTRKIGNGKTYKWALVRFGRRMASSKQRTVHIANLANDERAIMREANRYVTYFRESVEVVPVIDGIATISAETAARLASA
jgi:hypothetical protein